MKKNLPLTLLFILSLFQSNAQVFKKIHENKDLEQIIANHKTVAILPFSVSIKMKRLPKGVTPEMVKEDEKKEASNVQKSVFTFLLRKLDKYTVVFQDISKTNAILKKNNIDIENIDAENKDNLAKLLGVDAVISGSIELDKPVSQGVAAAIGLLAGVWVKSNEAQADLSIHNGSDGALLWRYSRQLGGTAFSSTDDLVDAIMRQVARNFPYEK